MEKTNKLKISLPGFVVTLIISLLLGGLVTTVYYQEKISRLERNLEQKTIYGYKNQTLENMEFYFAEHDDAYSKVDEIKTYWDKDFIIRVIRVRNEYYIKLYTEWEGLPE